MRTCLPRRLCFGGGEERGEREGRVYDRCGWEGEREGEERSFGRRVWEWKPLGAGRSLTSDT